MDFKDSVNVRDGVEAEIFTIVVGIVCLNSSLGTWKWRKEYRMYMVWNVLEVDVFRGEAKILRLLRKIRF